MRSETFFLSQALNPTGEESSSLYLPTVIVADGLNAASLESYQVVVLCNVSTLTDSAVAKIQNFLRQGGGLLIFGGDRLQMENYNLKLVQSSPPILPAQLLDKKLGPEAGGEKITKLDLSHPALLGFSDALLQESIKSARVWGYSRAPAPGKAVLISLANGDPLLLEQKVGNGRVLFMTTSADRDWNDLPVKTAYLPLIQWLTNYLAGGKRGVMDGGIPVGSTKEFSLPPSIVGKSFRITKPNRQEAEVSVVARKDRAAASFARKCSRRNLPRFPTRRRGQRKRRAPALRCESAFSRVAIGRNQRDRTAGEAQAHPRRGDLGRRAATGWEANRPRSSVAGSSHCNVAIRKLGRAANLSRPGKRVFTFDEPPRLHPNLISKRCRRGLATASGRGPRKTADPVRLRPDQVPRRRLESSSAGDHSAHGRADVAHQRRSSHRKTGSHDYATAICSVIRFFT